MRRTLSVVAIFAAALLIPVTVLAGGWAIVVIDEIPSALETVSGGPHRVGYTVLQHGLHPASGLHTSITIRSVRTGQALEFPGQADGNPGHYVAEIRFPSVGEWAWEVRPDPYPAQPMGTVMVVPKNLAHEGEPGTEASIATAAAHELRWPATLASLRFSLVVAALLAWALFGWSLARLLRAGGFPGPQSGWVHPS